MPFGPPQAMYQRWAPPAPSEPGPSQRKSILRLLVRNERGATVAPPVDGVPALWLRECSAVSGHDIALRGACYTADEAQRPYGQFTFCVEPIDRVRFPYGTPANNGKLSSNPGHFLQLFAGLMPNFMEDESDGPDGPEPRDHSTVYEPMVAELISKFPPVNVRREMFRRYAVNANAGTRCAVPFQAFSIMVEDVANATLCTDPATCRKGKSCMPLFSEVAEAAAAFAVGSLAWAYSAFPDATDRFVPSTPSMNADSNLAGVRPPRPKDAQALFRLSRLAQELHTIRHGYAAFDVHYIHAKVLCAQFLLFSHSLRGEAIHGMLSPEIPPLVGGLVWDARMMGLNIDPDAYDPPNAYGKLPMVAASRSTSGSDGQPAASGPWHNGFSDPSIKQEAEEDEEKSRLWKNTPLSIFEKEVRRRLWYSIVWLDL